MTERIIENWLTKASEKSFQVPFCYMLADQGYKVLHLTRHCGMEIGKDVLAINPEGQVCAYQLKGTDKKIKQSQWRDEHLGQIHQLVLVPPLHPSLPETGEHHKAYFVTNGEFEEEVSVEIQLLNDGWIKQGQPQLRLNVIVKGELLKWANELKTNLFPTEVKDFKALLEFFLEDGKYVLDKSKFCSLLEAHFAGRPVSSVEAKRVVSSGALLCSLAVSKYNEARNHIAIAEAWTIFLSYLNWFLERNDLNPKQFSNETDIAEQIIFNSLEELSEEVSDVKNFFVSENSVTDSFIVKYRILYVLGYISYLGLLHLVNGEVGKAAAIANKISPYEKYMRMWGESAIPFCLSHYFLLRYSADKKGQFLLEAILEGVIANHTTSGSIFPDPYYSVDEAVALQLNKDEDYVDSRNRVGTSHYLEPLIFLCVREDLRSYLSHRWPLITKIQLERMEPKVLSDYLIWRSDGTRHTYSNNRTESWSRLKKSLEVYNVTVPKFLQNNPKMYLLHLMVFSHRIGWEGLISFDKYLSERVGIIQQSPNA